MRNVVVASFKEEVDAIEALHKLDELDSFGDITIYEQIMVRKTEDGGIEILKQGDSEGWRTLTGMGVGSMIGLLGGPVGFVIGLYTGTAIGAIADARHYNFAEDFISKVESKIEVGTVSIIAEIEEYSEIFVDNYLNSVGAVITRCDYDLEFDKHVDEQIQEIEDEIAEEKAALKKSVGDDKKKIEKKIADLKEKRRARIAEVMEKRKQVHNNIKDKTGASKAKSNFEEFGNGINENLQTKKIERIKRKIGRHEETLNELNMQLKELQD